MFKMIQTTILHIPSFLEPWFTPRRPLATLHPYLSRATSNKPTLSPRSLVVRLPSNHPSSGNREPSFTFRSPCTCSTASGHDG
ncbi:hypothetical protein K438DRAFT_1867186 [Mycena galopus ATCC 62051]|nr:hypothetical protein K438DRAFT_1867186 [Mycena galopus ATCC 62051]